MTTQPTLDFPHAPDLEALWAWTRAQPWAEAELARGLADFMVVSGPATDPVAERQHDLRFVDWFHLDRPIPSLGAPPVALWLAATKRADSVLAHTVVGAFRVARTVPHSQAVLTGLRDGATYRVKDKALSVGLKRGQLAFGRLYPHGENWVTGGDRRRPHPRAPALQAAVATGLVLTEAAARMHIPLFRPRPPGPSDQAG